MDYTMCDRKAIPYNPATIRFPQTKTFFQPKGKINSIKNYAIFIVWLSQA